LTKGGIPYYDVRNITNGKDCALAVATITSKGQVTIPVKVRSALGLGAGDRIEFVEVGQGEFNIVAATRSVKELNGMLYRKGRKPVSIEEMNAAIAKGAARSR
jgi:AbrB family looped-hinge helix DNA binding protein